jgi:hypothetical protein
MDLKNGYKVIYDLAKDGKRNFYASKTGVFADAEPIFTDVEIGDYKLIYEKDGMFYGSTTGIPTANDICFEELNKVFVEEKPEEAVVAEDTGKDEDEPATDEGADDEGDKGTENETELKDEE